MCPESVLALHASKSSGVATPGHTWACAQVKINLRSKDQLLACALDHFHVDVKQAVPPTRGGGEQGQFTPGSCIRGPLNSARLIQIRSGSSVTFQYSVRFTVFSTEVSLFSFFALYAADTNFRLMHNYLTWLLRSPLARAPYIVLFDLKSPNEDGNLQVYMYCVHARKIASGAPRTQISLGHAPRPPPTNHIVGPHFLYLP